MLELHYVLTVLLITASLSFLAGWKFTAKKERDAGYMNALADHYSNVKRRYEAVSVKKHSRNHLRVVKGGGTNNG